MKKIILYELNEVPRKLFNFYVEKYPNSSFSKISEKGILFNTITKDTGELHPWSTWPTVHRGVYNSVHNIRYINQDLSAANSYKPIWEILSENKINVGVFGSLQSYPPISNKYIKFFLPDTFSPSPAASNEELFNFQKFNLNLTSDNKAISRDFKLHQMVMFLKLLNKGTISFNSLFSTSLHLFKESINSKYKSRRSIIQNVISFDLFKKYLIKYKPEFSTYFTNHVAGMMHRYWRDLFPEDFNFNYEDKNKFHSKSILKAMHLAENNLRFLINLADREGYEIFLVSSMGQQAIDRGKYIPEMVLREFEKFVKILQLNIKNYKLLPAMQPDYCIEAIDQTSLEELRQKLLDLKDIEGKNIFLERYEPVGLKLNLFLERSQALVNSKLIKIKDINYPVEKLGIEIIKRDIGTGYHIPNGIMAYYGNSKNSLIKYRNIEIETNKICPTFLKMFDIEIPKYMGSPLI
ncbi:MAG: hypothetical protein JJ834_002525 [Prochlorococcus marinus XMU1425]|nr:hypothetical protein [Prochlorococcus marinus XMU1425]MCR8534167.1 hypothetical protein [Prochlorococcus marinus XMU1426]